MPRLQVHLGLGASSSVLDVFDGTSEWYQRYSEEHAADGAEGRLVTVHSFSSDWPHWEVHPKGTELVYMVSGSMTLLQKAPKSDVTETELHAGEYAINSAGVWHTAKVSAPCTALFITAGQGTQHGTPPDD